MIEPNRDELAEIGRLIDEGKVSVSIQQTLPLAEVRRAHEFLQRKLIASKVVSSVSAAARISRRG